MPAGFNGQMAPGGSAASDVLESQTMTSDTVPPCFSSPRRGPPLDLVLHALQDALHGLALQASSDEPTMEAANLSGLACALTRAINLGALASSWAADGDVDIAGAHLARRLANPGGTPEDPRPTSNAEGRALETAVARRLADTACSLAITGDKEDAEHARALWEASATLTGLPVEKQRKSDGFFPLQHDPGAEARMDATMAKRYAEESRRSITIKPTPLILQSADEAPCGSLWETLDGPSKGRFVMRLTNGNGRAVPPTQYHALQWIWCEEFTRDDFPARLIAEGLTESECRHLSGLSAADAIAWCEARDKAAAPDADEPSAEAAILELLRAALAVPSAEDIVAHARKLKAELTSERETNARRMALLLQADERDDAVREVLGAGDGESTVDAAKRICQTFLDDLRKTNELFKDTNYEAQNNRRKAIMERDAAIESRAQMQARLVAVERERDAAQEEAKALRVAVANKMSESMLAIMEGIAKGPTMEWRNGKP